MDLVELTKKDLERRRYSPRTTKSYIFCIKKFLNYIKKEPRKINKKDIRKYLEILASEGKTAKTLNLYLQSIKYSLQYVLNKRNIFVNLPYAKQSKNIPDFLTKIEVKDLIEKIKNPQHRLLIELMYSAGLRLSETLDLQVKDLNFESNYGFVRQGKGNKDRYFLLAKRIKNKLKNHVLSKKENNLVFEGRNGRFSNRTVHAILQKAKAKAKIKKRIHPHILRHSFATHLIQGGCSLVSVQSLLGHKSPETTMIYVHMAKPKICNIESPYDEI